MVREREIDNEEINKLVYQIVNEFPAEEVFLFGSYAYGDPKEESDIDLCIITNEEGRKIDLLKRIRRAIAPIVAKPVDLLVYRKSEFYERAALVNTFENKIMNEGIKLYETL